MVCTGCVGSTDIADGGVSLADLAPNSVDSSKIVDLSVGLADLAPNSVDSTKILDGTVSLLDLASNSVDSSKIVDGSIGSADVNSAQIQLRITSSCPAGQSIRQVNADGTVVCEVDDTGSGGVTAVTASAPLASSGGTTPHISLPNVIIGISNTAIGTSALRNNTTGGNNTAIGSRAGFNQTTGSNNIYVDNEGVAAESNTIRIGDSQTRAFIREIRGVTTGVANAVTVLIDSNGQLGTISSSRRFKEEIRDMAEASSSLLRLRPVTFRYKQHREAEGNRPLEYGLIAEEVANVYPDLVVYSRTGEVETVQYHKLTTMLLNEVQKQHQQLEKQRAENADLRARLARIEQMIGSYALAGKAE